MFEQITDYLNENKYIGIIIVLALAIIVLWIYNSCSCLVSESFDQGGQTCSCSPAQDETFYTQFVMGNSNLVNFKCTYKGTDYYLANVQLSSCSNQEHIDCTAAVLVLMPVSDVNTQLQQYLTNVQTDTTICNTTNKLKCLGGLTPPVSEEQEEVCMKPSQLCNSPRMFYHDFNVMQANSSSGVRKYLIKGTAIPERNNVITPTLFNQNLYDGATVKNLMCADTYSYSPTNSPEFVEVMVIERLDSSGIASIVGASSQLKIKLKFNTKIYIPSKTGFTALNDPTTGNPQTKPTYIGICPDLTCNMTGSQYPRVCLYDDPFDPNVLEFEPLLV